MRKQQAQPRLVAMIPNRDTTPQVVLERTLDKIDRIKSIAVVIVWKGEDDDEEYGFDHSIMTTGTLGLCARILEAQTNQEFFHG